MDTSIYFKIPYKKHGRDWTGADCYGFIRIVLERERGLKLPLLNGKDTVDLEFYTYFEPIIKPEDFAIVYLSGGPFHGAHTGIYYQGSILQMTNNGVCMIPAQRLSRYIKGYYRPKI